MIAIELYRDFTVDIESIPYFLIHMQIPSNLFDMRVQADLRKIFFKPHLED